MWENGNSRTSTPEWKETRERIFTRDGHQCVATLRKGQRCPETTNLRCDHIINHAAGGTDDDDNLQTLCDWHHKRKTATEAAQARPQRSNPALRPAELHPALRPTPSPRSSPYGEVL